MQDHTPAEKWVAVTGAASGIGTGVCDVLAAAGHPLLLVDRDRAGLEALHARIPLSKIVEVDLADESSPDVLAEAAVSVPLLWGLVNSAGISHVEHFLASPAPAWERVLAVNVVGTFRAVHAMAPAIHDGGGGAIVNISSISGSRPPALQAVYAASKAAVNAFTEGLAFDLGPANITVNAISPGVVRTPIWEAALESESAQTGLSKDEVFRQHVAPVPLGRAQTPTDVGELCAFLLGPAARNISGDVIRLTGGLAGVEFDFATAASEYASSRVRE